MTEIQLVSTRTYSSILVWEKIEFLQKLQMIVGTYVLLLVWSLDKNGEN